ncbi:hypothetical protein F3Y22_tig00110220pilonHSYRG00044 [Hibiscus syriacus]|uniref:Uncharacterized protein n=1 Tax=Hibiscus syriacus TaxID=106335 RepID=A0A6A3B7N6_HIBSY|nr:hypothetical protein F3Y22_tig00110220pilonHSYRG00044 [Hibiscus syriacus]
MEIFDVSNNNMDDKIPNAIAAEAPSSVSLLNLRDNRLSGNIPAQIGLLPGLRILLLGNNRFNGSIPGQLCELRNISIMDLSNNSFAGQEKFVPYIVDFNQDIYDDSSFWNSVQLEDAYSLGKLKGDILKYMSGLDLSCNNLIGFIPQSLGKLTSLHALNLSNNHLTGFIPVSFSNLAQVESLDFSYNNLSGKIPSELVDLNFLAVFSVAHNNLSGRVPDKGQFATFGFNSYEGNPWLSGIPSEKNGTRVIETPFPSDELKKNAVLYINTYWRRWWSHFIEKSIYSFYFFVVDPLRKLATNFKHQFFT